MLPNYYVNHFSKFLFSLDKLPHPEFFSPDLNFWKGLMNYVGIGSIWLIAIFWPLL